MGRCANCRAFILGGRKQGDLRYCNDACLQQGFLAPLADRVAPEIVARNLQATHQQPCPICHGPGPVDLYTSHTAWSIFILTSWCSQPQLSCESCGSAAIRKGMVITALCGWWGIPFGLVVTPWQLLNGARSLANRPLPSHPSEALQHLVKLNVGAAIAQQAELGEAREAA